MADTNFNVINYKGLKLLTPDPTGEGGELINDNLRTLADRVTSLEFDISGDGAQSLNSLSDVTILIPVDTGELLAYNASLGKWVNQTPEEAGVALFEHTHTASDITDLSTAISSNSDVVANTAHRDATDNPHNVTHTQVGSATAQWNANKFLGRDLSDTAPEDGQVLKWNSVSNVWEPSDDLTTGGITLNEITDVDTSGTPDDNEVLAYDTDTGLWTRKTASEANLATADHAHTINSLSNVQIEASVASGEVIAFNGVNAWINRTLAEAGIAALNHTHTADDITDIDTAIATNTAVAANTAHSSNTSNPHNVTSIQVGRSTAQWNADKLQGNAISSTAPSDGEVLQWDADTSTWTPGEFTGASSLSGLDDTTITTPISDDSLLAYDSLASKWVNKSLSDIDANIAQIPSNSAHRVLTNNPHSVTAAQVGNTTAQWNASQLRGINIGDSTPSNGQVLKYVNGSWVPANESGGSGGGGSDFLDDLLDVSLDDVPEDYSLLTYNPSGGWTNITLLDNPDFTEHTHDLDSLADVDLDNLANGQFLSFDESVGTEGAWINKTLTLNTISDVSVSGASSGDVLGFNGTTWEAIAGLGSDGIISLEEISDTPDATAGFGKIYVQDDSLLYYLDGDGIEQRVSTIIGEQTTATFKHYLLNGTTNNATPIELQISGGSDLYVNNNAVITYQIMISAASEANETLGDSGSWIITGGAANSDGTLTLTDTNEVVFDDGNDWTVEVSAANGEVDDDKNVPLKITVTGEAGASIRWSAAVIYGSISAPIIVPI